MRETKNKTFRLSEDEIEAFSTLMGLDIAKTDRALLRHLMVSFVSTALAAVGDRRRFLTGYVADLEEKDAKYKALPEEEKEALEQEIFTNAVHLLQAKKDLDAAAALVEGLLKANEAVEKFPGELNYTFSFGKYSDLLIKNYQANTDEKLRGNLEKNGLLNDDCKDEEK